MATQNASRDDNRVTTLVGVDSTLFADSTTVAVDPTTHEMLVKGTLNTGDIQLGAVEIKDGDTDTRAVVQTDGVDNALLTMESFLAIKKTISGSVTYVGMAAPGTAEATEAWACFKKDESTANEVTITWADGDAAFDNAATDLTALSYS